MNNPDYIDNDEELYRRIELNELNTKTPPHYIVKASGEIKIESAAFLGGERPSVDRAKLQDKPEDSKKNVTDGIISVTAEDVRAISIQDYTTDVEHVPLENNDAHSEIVLNSNRDGISNSRKRRAHSYLRRGLADIAVCKIKPTAYRP